MMRVSWGQRIAAATVIGAVVVAVVAWMATPANASAPPPPIGLTGEVDGLYPGATATMDVHLTNHQSFTIRVTSVDVAVLSSPTCPARFLSVGGSRTPVEVAPTATAIIAVPVQMDRAAPDACQGAVFPLDLSASAVEAGDAAAPPPSLALTGVALVRLVVVALALVVTGATARLVARRRAKGTTP
jgi:hypothetical protein